MKFRSDFVTNSSSSSFVCEICGRTEGGYDLCLSDCEMMQCVNGHIFCADEALDQPSKEEMVKIILENEYNKNAWDDELHGYRDYSEDEIRQLSDDILFSEWLTDGGYYDVPECVCPICQFIEYSEVNLSAYLLKVYGIPKEDVFEEVKKTNKRRKKLYDSEYITYVCQKFNLNPAEIVASWREKFNSYNEFNMWLR